MTPNAINPQPVMNTMLPVPAQVATRFQGAVAVRTALVGVLLAGGLAGCGGPIPPGDARGSSGSGRTYVPTETQLGQVPALYNCGGRDVVVGRVGQMARVTLGPEQADLLPLPGHASQRFVGQDTALTTAPSPAATQLSIQPDGMTLNWAGQSLGFCRLVRWFPSTLDGQGYALGHAPGWAFHIDTHGARMQWEAQGQRPASVEAIKLNPGQALALGQPFAFGDAVVSSSVTVTHEVCVDGRSEWPRPYRVEVRRDGQTWVGCGGNPLSLLQSKVWTYQPTSAAAEQPQTLHTATVRFDAAGRLAGDSGCNRFQAAYALDGNFLKLQPLATTRKSCLGSVMAFEKTLVEWLPKVSRFQLSDAGDLTLLTADGRSFVLH